MLNAFNDLLCSKLCWHNRLVPAYSCIDTYVQPLSELQEKVLIIEYTNYI